MNNFDKIVGVLFMLIGFVDLLRRDWVHFILLSAAGAGLLIGSNKSRMARTAQAVLFLMAGVMLVVSLARW